VHDLAPERLRLGVGSGNRAFLKSRYGLAQIAPLSYLKEYLEVLRGVVWEGRIDYQGAFFQVAHTLPRTAPVPVLISTLGLKQGFRPLPYMRIKNGIEQLDRYYPQVGLEISWLDCPV
jgi:alkanesulfonate monooxygenase SsuD/methylene tetrahydromethanopterin reductase-like flavin-dependent oxidoreductase (luciferase family)